MYDKNKQQEFIKSFEAEMQRVYEDYSAEDDCLSDYPLCEPWKNIDEDMYEGFGKDASEDGIIYAQSVIEENRERGWE